MRLGNEAVALGRVSWQLLVSPRDVRQLVFNVAYHLGQDYMAVWSWPLSHLREAWDMMEAQLAFERPKD